MENNQPRVWAFNKVPNNDDRQKVYESIKNGISRFGWSQDDEHNLKIEGGWSDWHSKNLFLLQIKPGDWIVHINMPSYGKCTAAQVKTEYNFDEGLINSSGGIDFRCYFEIDKETIIEFDRNDPKVHPLVSRRLKLQGRYWKIHKGKEEFFNSIKSLKSGKNPIEEDSTIGVFHLREDLKPLYGEITKMIHKTHPEKKLESFLAEVFKNIPNVTEAKVNGSGWGTDYGADIIVKYNTGLDILNLNKEETLVVQVKSYEGEHWSTEAVRQINTAIIKFEADAGIIITTAKSTEKIEQEIEKVSNELDKPIALIAGEDVAKFVLKYGKDLLINI